MSDFRSDFIRLGEQLSQERNAAYDLWTWLPSYKHAQAAFGDYASEHMPSVHDVMLEAATFFAHGMLPTPAQIEEAGDIYRCADAEDALDESKADAEDGNADAAERVRKLEAFERWQRTDLRIFSADYWERHQIDPVRYPLHSSDGAPAPWKAEAAAAIAGA